VIIGDHDGVCDSLGNNIVRVIFHSENDLETQFLILVPTVTGNSHW
jgi:hypothetical protein